MLIWMRHPQHGRLPAHDNAERDRLIGFGWHVETPEEAPGYQPPQPVKKERAKRGTR